MTMLDASNALKQIIAEVVDDKYIPWETIIRMAKRSGTETAAILEVAKRLNIIHEDNYQKGRELLIRIIMMLTKLAQKSD